MPFELWLPLFAMPPLTFEEGVEVTLAVSWLPGARALELLVPLVALDGTSVELPAPLVSFEGASLWFPLPLELLDSMPLELPTLLAF